MFLKLFLYFNIFSVCVSSRYGIDSSVLINSTTFNCLIKEYLINYIKIRIYRSIGDIDSNSIDTIKSGYSSGINDIDVYIFPCISSSSYSISHNITCETPTNQIIHSIKYLEENGIQIKRKNNKNKLNNDIPIVTRFWFDIEDEDPSKYFDSDPTVNQKVLAELTEAGENENLYLGIYTTKTYWNNIMGNIEGYGQYPLWYPRYDGVNSMDFFVPFADFTEVLIKQTGGDVGYCGITQVDSDYME